MSANTTASYIKLLEAVLLVTSLPAWGLTVSSRAVSSFKIHILDSGVGTHVLPVDLTGNRTDRSHLRSGRLAECSTK